MRADIRSILFRVCGIYRFWHVATGRSYIGSSVNCWERYCAHLIAVAKGSKNAFHRAIRELGIDAFECEILEACGKYDLLAREKFYIEKFDAASINGFNTRADPFAYYDHKPSPVTLERMRLAGMRRIVSPETCKRMKMAKKGFRPALQACSNGGKTHKGRKRSAETIERCKTAAQARALEKLIWRRLLELPKPPKPPKGPRPPMTEEQKEKIRATLRAKGIKPPSRKGTTSSAETREKQSFTLKGRALSDEHRAALSEATKNRSPEHFARISAAKMGHTVSEETRAKIRASLTGKKRTPPQ